MRCTNCGWNNPEGLKFCQKCNEPLNVLEIHSTPLPVDVHKVDDHKTEECENLPNAIEGKSLSCKKCGYPILPDTEVCPNCGAQLKLPAVKEESVEKTEISSFSSPYSREDGRATVKNATGVLNENVQNTSPMFANATVRESFVGKDFKREEQKVALRETVRDASSVNFENATVEDIPSELKLHPVDLMGIEGEAVKVSKENSQLSSALFTAGKKSWEIDSKSQTVFIQVSRPITLESGDTLVIDGKKYKVEL